MDNHQKKSCIWTGLLAQTVMLVYGVLNDMFKFLVWMYLWRGNWYGLWLYPRYIEVRR